MYNPGLELTNRSDVKTKFNNTIMMIDYTPCYFYTDDSDLSLSTIHVVRYYPITSKPSTAKKEDYRTIKGLRTGSPPLGYMNVNENTRYLVRSTERRYNWGITPPNILSKNYSSKGYFPTMDRNLFCSPMMYNTISGIYPDYRNAVEKLLNEEVESVAISRHVALQDMGGKTYGLLYRNALIGISHNLGSSSFTPFVEPSMAKYYNKFLANASAGVILNV